MAKEIFHSVNPDKDWQEDFEHENGNYQCQCMICKDIFYGHKRRVICKLCAHPKQPGYITLDFTDIFHYVKSLQLYAGMNNEEASTLYHILDMWQKKRYFEPATYELTDIPPSQQG